MQYEEFDKFITEMSQQNISDDYWYDVGVEDAIRMLNHFSKEDWRLLETNINYKSLGWQKRVIYCFEEGSDIRKINIIISLVETKDKELFQMCIDSLRFLINDNNKDFVIENSKFINKLLEFSQSDNILGGICRELVSKLGL